MPSSFQLDILTPERLFYSGLSEGVIVTTPDGELGVQARHAPLVTPLEVGVIDLNIAGEWRQAFISEGFMEVGSSRTVIFTQACEWPEDIDTRRAEEARQREQERLRQRTSIREQKASQVALARAMARLRVTRGQVK